MASISATATTTAASFIHASLRHNPSLAAPVLGLPVMAKKGRAAVKCSAEGNGSNGNSGWEKQGMMSASLMAAVSSPAAMVLVDERMTTEGTGLPSSSSNKILTEIDANQLYH